ncbi:hypothetical protein Q8G40_29815, partial [Klebsiella pneumoniae]|uniref:hypothetical protein n=1 Tax=Klebsiella pneumoniae TaxID=573 RepID=UPI00301416C6
AQVEILIKEKTQRVKHVKTEAELLAEAKGKPMWIPEFDYPFTGELTLTIDSPFAPKRNWKDNATKKIEANMNEIITSIFIAAEE